MTEVSHKVLGITGKEPVVTLTNKTFCGLCSRQADIGEEAIELLGKTRKGAKSPLKFYVHIDCAVASMTKMHNSTFREDVKVRPAKKTGKRQKKQPKQGNGGHCAFCMKKITNSQTYIADGKKHFHNDGVNSCITRYRRVVSLTKHSLGY